MSEMQIVREFACTPEEFFEAAATRFGRECAAHGAPVEGGTLAVGSGYGGDGGTVRVTVLEPGRSLGWTARSLAGSVTSHLGLDPCKAGCRVAFDQDYEDAAAGKLKQALIFGQMSNMLIGIFDEVECRREGGDAVARSETPAQASPDSLSLRLFRHIFARK